MMELRGEDLARSSESDPLSRDTSSAGLVPPGGSSPAGWRGRGDDLVGFSSSSPDKVGRTMMLLPSEETEQISSCSAGERGRVRGSCKMEVGSQVLIKMGNTAIRQLLILQEKLEPWLLIAYSNNLYLKIPCNYSIFTIM